jgi:hypothetical protein
MDSRSDRLGMDRDFDLSGRLTTEQRRAVEAGSTLAIWRSMFEALLALARVRGRVMDYRPYRSRRNRTGAGRHIRAIAFGAKVRALMACLETSPGYCSPLRRTSPRDPRFQKQGLGAAATFGTDRGQGPGAGIDWK